MVLAYFYYHGNSTLLEQGNVQPLLRKQGPSVCLFYNLAIILTKPAWHTHVLYFSHVV